MPSGTSVEEGFRRARPADLPAVSTLQREAILALAASSYGAAGAAAWARWQAADARSLLDHDGEVFVAEEDGALIAVGSWRADPGSASTAYVRAVFVSPRRARRGVGARLMATIEAGAAAAGRIEFRLVASENARPFYEALGYAVVAPHRWEIDPGTSLSCARMAKSAPSAD